MLASDLDREVPHLATAPLEGKPLWVLLREADRERRAALLKRVGRTLAALHADRFDAHGRVVGGASGLDLRTGAWTDVLAATIEEMRELAPSDRYASHFEAVREAIEAERGRLNGAPAALLHGDPAAPNFLVTDDRIGCVDWERAHVGDPARDLYRARDQLVEPTRGSGDGRLVEALHAGYRERAGGLPAGLEDRRPVYRLVRLLGVSGFFERHVETREESAAELADWLEAEFDRRLAAV
jgi:aminoglycoside phosphotransferase (APT) family kinase protein